MKNSTLKIASILTLLVLVAQSFAQQNSSALLYEITGSKLSKPSYLLGTFHAICPTDMLPAEKLTSYVARTEQLLLELDLDDPAVTQTMVGGLMMKDGKSLKDLYTDAEYAKVDELLKSTIGVSADALKNVKPSMLAVMVITNPKSLGCTPSAVDMVIMQAAVAKKMPINGLETVAQQMNLLDHTPLEKQARDLYKMAADPQRSINELKSMMAVYKAQDSEKPFQVTAKQMRSERSFQTKLLDDRNKAWIPILESSMKEDPVFIAVGAAHLGGSKGVVKLLRAKGYKVKPIRL